MKKLLFIMGLCCSVSMANAQESTDLTHSFRDNQNQVIGYIRNGSIIDKNNGFLGQFKSENGQYSVLNSQQQVIGYILREHEVQDASHKTVGYFHTSRTDYSTTVEDAQHKVIGYIKHDGKIEDANHKVIGYQERTEHMWAATYYFFLKF